MRVVLREEKKRLLSVKERSDIENRLGAVMMADDHNGDEGYIVRSLYFDTPDEKDYNEKLDGTELRRKVRLRIYSPLDEVGYLEIKQKEGAYQKKRSLPLNKKAIMELLDGITVSCWTCRMRLRMSVIRSCSLVYTGQRRSWNTGARRLSRLKIIPGSRWMARLWQRSRLLICLMKSLRLIRCFHRILRYWK